MSIKSLFLRVNVPSIPPGTVIERGPLLLLRQFAVPVAPYDLSDIMKRVVECENHGNSNEYYSKFKHNLIYEIADNNTLKQQMQDEDVFKEWVAAANNISIKPFTS